jgi:hypothetical protein
LNARVDAKLFTYVLNVRFGRSFTYDEGSCDVTIALAACHE